MSTLSLRLPNSLHKQLAEVAKTEGVSLNQLISTAASEKLAALMTAEYLAARAERGRRKKFDAVLAKVADIEPEDFDRLPNKRVHQTRGSTTRR